MFWSLIKTMRPKQWVKNGAIFAALVFDEKLFASNFFIQTLLGFVLLSLISGTVYVINDLVDVEKDRLHPKKSFVPSHPVRLVYNLRKSLLLFCLLSFCH